MTTRLLLLATLAATTLSSYPAQSYAGTAPPSLERRILLGVERNWQIEEALKKKGVSPAERKKLQAEQRALFKAMSKQMQLLRKRQGKKAPDPPTFILQLAKKHAPKMVPKIMKRLRQAAEINTKMVLNNACTALQTFRMDRGRLPSAKEGLELLLKHKIVARPLLDGWRRPLVYRPLKAGSFQLSSNGADGKVGTADDRHGSCSSGQAKRTKRRGRKSGK